MLVKFESPSSGPFITTQSVAEQLVKAMGKSDSLEGIIVSKEVKKTIQKLIKTCIRFWVGFYIKNVAKMTLKWKEKIWKI